MTLAAQDPHDQIHDELTRLASANAFVLVAALGR
jgi:hypothetical protein